MVMSRWCLLAVNGASALTLAMVSSRRGSCAELRNLRTTHVYMGLFDGIFGNADDAADPKSDDRDEQWAAQQEILARRRDPSRNSKYLRDVESRRRSESSAFREKIAWQQDTTKDPIGEFKRRRADNKVNPLGYEDEPKGGIPFPMASFGVGGEFGVGGKYDNGERFDLRLPYVDQGWTEENDEEQVEQVDFFQNLLSGGRLQRKADQRWREKNEK